MLRTDIVRLAALIGEQSRATMLMGLLGGKALPASELARLAGITPQTASSHLAKMVSGGLLVQETFGRHRYYRLTSREIGEVLEALNVIAPEKPIRSLREADQSKALHYARTCYDHVAGQLGVAITDKLLELGCMRAVDRDYVITTAGSDWFANFGLDLEDIVRSRRHFARQCLDWSERRPHLAGALGAKLTNRLFELGWIVRVPGDRILRITNIGSEGLKQKFGI